MTDIKQNDLVRFKPGCHWDTYKNGIYSNRTFIVDNVQEGEWGYVYIRPLTPREGDSGVSWITQGEPGGFDRDSLVILMRA